MTKDRLQRGLRTTFFGLFANLFLATGKLAAGIFGHSQALIADGVESLADIFSSLIVWRGIVVASAPADEDHPYGHGKAEPIASAIVATMLLLAALGIAIKSIQEVFNSHQTPAAYTLLVLIAVIAIKEVFIGLLKVKAMPLKIQLFNPMHGTIGATQLLRLRHSLVSVSPLLVAKDMNLPTI
jgi:cation diffusion facilitator family transporter